MILRNLRRPFEFLIQSFGILCLAATAQAVPIDGTVSNSGSGYSVVHNGATPSGSGNSMDWLWFDDNQFLSFDLTSGIVSLSGNQLFNLTSENGANAVLEITDLDLDLNDAGDGFSGGSLDYILDGSISGTFLFADNNYGSSLFNSSSFDGTNFEFYVWGGDEQHNLGIDLGVTGTVIEPDPMPTPGSLALSLLALVALRRSQIRRG